MKKIFLPFIVLLAILAISFESCMQEPASTHPVAYAKPIEQATTNNTDVQQLNSNNAVTHAVLDTSSKNSVDNNAILPASASTKTAQAATASIATTTTKNKTIDNKLKNKTKSTPVITQENKKSTPTDTEEKDKPVQDMTNEQAPTINTATPEEMALLGEEPTPERATAPATPNAGGSMNFSEKTHEFGTIPMGGVVSHDFSFTNKGTAPLVIYEATSTCGCTIPDYPKEPILPGEKGSVKVTYDSKGKIGIQNKEVTIRTNSGIYKINMKGMVVPDNFMPDKDKKE